MVKIFIAQLNYGLGDLGGNCTKILAGYAQALNDSANIALFSRYAIPGYIAKIPFTGEFLKYHQKCVTDLASHTTQQKTPIVVGGLGEVNGELHEIIYLLSNGTIKILFTLPLHTQYQPFNLATFYVGALHISLVIEEGGTSASHAARMEEICKQVPNSTDLLIFMGKAVSAIVSPIYATLADRLGAHLVYVNLLGGYRDKVFPGGSFIHSKGKTYTYSLWGEESKSLGGDLTDNLTDKIHADDGFTYQNLILALRDYAHKNGFTGVTLGMSGGIDSALVGALAADALGAENVHTFMLSTRYTSRASVVDAEKCATLLGVHHKVTCIENMFCAALEALKVLPQSTSPKDVTEENIQSRIRGMFLMAVSNRMNLLLLATGNKSELLTGYMTLYGDTCGGFAPIRDIYKTGVCRLAKWRNSNVPQGSLCKKTGIIPEEIITKAPSAELKPNQKDQDALPDYPTLDGILHLLVDKKISKEEIVKRYDKDEVELAAQLVNKASFKLSQLPIGPSMS